MAIFHDVCLTLKSFHCGRIRTGVKNKENKFKLIVVGVFPPLRLGRLRVHSAPCYSTHGRSAPSAVLGEANRINADGCATRLPLADGSAWPTKKKCKQFPQIWGATRTGTQAHVS